MSFVSPSSFLLSSNKVVLPAAAQWYWSLLASTSNVDQQGIPLKPGQVDRESIFSQINRSCKTAVKSLIRVIAKERVLTENLDYQQHRDLIQQSGQ